jgi:hypothetical protein
MSVNGQGDAAEKSVASTTSKLYQSCVELVDYHRQASSSFTDKQMLIFIELFDAASRALLASANEDVRLAEKQCEALWPTWRQELGLAPSAQWPGDLKALWSIVRRFTAPYEKRVALNVAAKRLVRTRMQLDQVQSYVESMRLTLGLS